MYKQEILFTIGLLFSLIVFNFINKRKENFTDEQRKSALDGLITQNKLFNSIFTKITGTDIDINKNINLKKDLDITGKVNVNKLRISKNWTGYGDANKAIDQSEIANDTNVFKKLMIVGNSSAGGKRRRVGIWDDLDVDGNLHTKNKIIVDKELCIGDVCINKEHLLALKGDRDIFIRNVATSNYLGAKAARGEKKHNHNLYTVGVFENPKKTEWERIRINY